MASDDPSVAEDEIPFEGEIRCVQCGITYPVLLGIPDLRLWPDPYISMAEDRAKASMLAQRCAGLGFEDSLLLYYSITAAVPPFQATRFVRSLLAAEARADTWLRALEEGVETVHGGLIDVGCGTAPILVSASGRYRHVVGVDVALRWLVLARKRLDEAGIKAPLVCACAEALPFARESFDVATADSTLEHLRDQGAGCKQLQLVLRGGGRLFVSTPNRRSIGPDPHTGLPAGGWLPDAISAAYVTRKGGIPPRRNLLSAGMLRDLLARNGFDEIVIEPPSVPKAQRASFGRLARAAIDAYLLMRRLPGGSAVLRAVGPLLTASARRKTTYPSERPYPDVHVTAGQARNADDRGR